MEIYYGYLRGVNMKTWDILDTEYDQKPKVQIGDVFRFEADDGQISTEIVASIIDNRYYCTTEGIVYSSYRFYSCKWIIHYATLK